MITASGRALYRKKSVSCCATDDGAFYIGMKMR